MCIHRQSILLFFHPDYTVGTGITPVRPIGSRTVTAGGESHPALKNMIKLLLSEVFQQNIFYLALRTLSRILHDGEFRIRVTYVTFHTGLW